MIIIEYPHRGPRRVWSVRDQAEFLDVVAEISTCSISSEDYDLSDIDQALEWLRHDLQALHVLQSPSSLSDWEDPDIEKHARRIGWRA